MRVLHKCSAKTSTISSPSSPSRENEASLRSGGPRVPELDWKSYRETGPDNTVSGSTTNGGSVLLGKMTVRRTLKSWTIIRGSKMKKNGMRPVPPGEILNEEFLKPLGLTANVLAKAIGVPPNRITAILKDERGITGDTAIRLGTFFKTSAEFWMNLQMTYDLRNAEKALPARVRKSIEDNRSVLT